MKEPYILVLGAGRCRAKIGRPVFAIAIVLVTFGVVLDRQCPAHANASLTNAKNMYKNGDWRGAKNALIDLVCMEPRNYRFRYWLGIVSLGLKDYHEAATHFEFCLEMYPDAHTASLCNQALEIIGGKLGREFIGR